MNWCYANTQLTQLDEKLMDWLYESVKNWIYVIQYNDEILEEYL